MRITEFTYSSIYKYNGNNATSNPKLHTSCINNIPDNSLNNKIFELNHCYFANNIKNNQVKFTSSFKIPHLEEKIMNNLVLLKEDTIHASRVIGYVKNLPKELKDLFRENPGSLLKFNNDWLKLNKDKILQFLKSTQYTNNEKIQALDKELFGSAIFVKFMDKRDSETIKMAIKYKDRKHFKITCEEDLINAEQKFDFSADIAGEIIQNLNKVTIEWVNSTSIGARNLADVMMEALGWNKRYIKDLPINQKVLEINLALSENKDKLHEDTVNLLKH